MLIDHELIFDMSNTLPATIYFISADFHSIFKLCFHQNIMCFPNFSHILNCDNYCYREDVSSRVEGKSHIAKAVIVRTYNY